VVKYVIKNATWSNMTIIFLLAIILGLMAVRDADQNLRERQLWECINSGKSWNDQFEFHYESTDIEDVRFIEILNRY